MRTRRYSVVFLLAAGAACTRVGSADRSANQQPVDIPAKTELYLRLDRAVDSAKSKVGDRVAAHLESPVVVDGRDVVPKGTKFDLRVTNSLVAREKGSIGLLTLNVDSFSLNGHNYPVKATALTEQTKPLPGSADPNAQAPHLPLREDQAQSNAAVTTQRVLPFVTTEPVHIGG
jgi:hypothetical protein